MSFRIGLIVVIAAGIGSALMYGYSQHNQAQQLSEIQSYVTKEKQDLVTVADAVHAGKAIDEVRTIVRDCESKKRERFDLLLGQLDNLTATEIVELETLFSACANFFAQQKAVMALLLETEVREYAAAVALWESVTDQETAEYKVETWRALALAESQQSAAFFDLVKHQRSIIEALLSGHAADSDVIKEILLAVQNTQEEISFAGIQINQLRTELDEISL